MFTGRDEGALPGASDLIPVAERPMSEHAIRECATALQESGLPLAATMGPSDWGGFIKRLAMRKLVRELPPQKIQFPWFVCHVPPSGTSAMQLETSRSSDAGITLKIFGSGFGKGRKITETANTKLAAHSKCLEHRIDLRVISRIFSAGTEEFVETEILERLGESPQPLAQCPVCKEVAKSPNPLRFKAGPYIDLRSEREPATKSFSIEVRGSTKIESGFEYPGVPVKLTITATVEESRKLSVESSLRNGYVYTPFTRVGSRGPIETYVWAREK